MRAVRFDRYGGREVLYVAEVEDPEPADGEVVVEVRAAGINPGEAAIRSGALEAVFPATFPSGEGSDLAGVVSSVGEGVAEFSVGDEVMGWSWQRSSHAEYVAVPVGQLIAKPAALSWEVAGSLYVVGCTAYAAVRAVVPDRAIPSRCRRRPAGWARSSSSSCASGARAFSASRPSATTSGSALTGWCRSPTATAWPTA